VSTYQRLLLPPRALQRLVRPRQPTHLHNHPAYHQAYHRYLLPRRRATSRHVSRVFSQPEPRVQRRRNVPASSRASVPVALPPCRPPRSPVSRPAAFRVRSHLATTMSPSAFAAPFKSKAASVASSTRASRCLRRPAWLRTSGPIAIWRYSSQRPRRNSVATRMAVAREFCKKSSLNCLIYEPASSSQNEVVVDPSSLGNIGKAHFLVLMRPF
jgi:hypothetical protein